MKGIFEIENGETVIILFKFSIQQSIKILKCWGQKINFLYRAVP